jgi:hypothetical protein
VLLDRPARAARADREPGQAVLLDEALLDHHQGLGGHDVVAPVAERIARAERDGKAKAQRVVRQRGGRHVSARPVGGGAATPEGIAELAVPARSGSPAPRRPRVRDGGGRVVDDRDPVDRLVDRARLDADDVVHGMPIDGRRLREVRGERRRQPRQGLKRARRGAIEPLVARRHGAMLVERGPKAGRFGLTDPRHLVWAREDRAIDREVAHVEAGVHRRVRRLRRRPEDIVTVAQARHEADQRAARVGGPERAGHVATIQGHPDVREADARGDVDPDEHVAAAHPIGAGRQRRDDEGGCARMARRGDEPERDDDGRV